MPWINLDGAVNVRDVGGLATVNGGVTAGRRLLRSDNLQDLSPADVTLLVKDIGVTTVIDLRSTAEVTAEGPAPLDTVPGVRRVHHPVLPELGMATDVVADVLLVRGEADRSRYPANPVTGHYLGYLEDRPDAVVAAVRDIATAEGAAVVHCAGGKDRTGVVVAVALSAIGVRPEAIVADYAATGERIDALLARLRGSEIYRDDVDSRPVSAHTARPETMTAFLDQLDARHGGAAKWLAAHGFDDDLATLRAKLLQP